MEDGDLSSLIVFFLLIMLHALVALTYASLVNSRQSLMRDEADEGNTQAQRVLNLLENFARLNVTYQLTLLFTRLAIAAIATINIAQPLIAGNPAIAPGLVYLLVLVGTALLTLILGDLLPAAIGNARSDGLAMFFSGFMRLIVFLLSPLVRVTIFVSKQLSALFGGDVADAAVTEEEIITLVDAGQKEGTIETDEKAMILSILHFDETLAREVMVPRMDIVALEITTPFEEALARFVQSGHSRIPLYTDSIDNIEGLLYAKDMLSLRHNDGPKPHSIRELMRPAHFVPESLRADLLLKELQKSKIHMAIVVDEYGGTAGLVTIENLIEEIVGDIQDEYDINEEAEYIQENKDEYLIDAGMNLDDVNELLDVSLPTEDNDTLGGYIYSRIGRVPLVGEEVDDDDNELAMRVESVDGRRIRKVRVTRIRPAEEADSNNRDNELEPTPGEEVSRKAG